MNSHTATVLAALLAVCLCSTALPCAAQAYETLPRHKALALARGPVLDAEGVCTRQLIDAEHDGGRAVQLAVPIVGLRAEFDARDLVQPYHTPFWGALYYNLFKLLHVRQSSERRYGIFKI